MTRTTLLTTLCTLCLMVLGAAPSFAITTQEIADLGRARVADDVIVALIQSSGSIPQLTPQEVITLKEAGVSDTVLRVLLSTREERNSAYEYDQAMRRAMLMNFQFPAGYFDNTYSGIHQGYGGSLTPVRPIIPGYGYSGTPGASTGGMYGFGYYPDYVRTGPDGLNEFNYNLGGNPGVLYDKFKFKDLWTLNFALFGTPPGNRLYFRN